ncbi:MAG: hypothetical protein EP329_10970 [Deltaproteobacteria bacterium]|nr:MAG: hypothetical protein EP329_10970 [Deltaproteobacteria bacterium]
MQHNRAHAQGAQQRTPMLGNHRTRPDLRGKSLDEQQAMLDPNGGQLAPTDGPGTDEQADKLKAAIDRSSEIFAEERKENDPYGEAYLDKHYRHGRNKAKKADIRRQHAPASRSKNPFKRLKERRAITKQVKAEYEKVREVSPDKARRMRNAELKATIQEEAKAEAETLHPNDEKAQAKAYESIWLRNYKLTREYVGGASDKEKVALSVEDELIKENNKKLKAQLLEQAGEDPIAIESATKIYKHARGRTREMEKEHQKEKQAAQDKATEEKRKKDNGELKAQIKAKHGDGKKAKQAAQKEYLEKKTKTAKAQVQEDKAKAKARVKAHNKTVKNRQKGGWIDDKTAAEELRYVGDKGRKKKNAALKKAFSREEYREKKDHAVSGDVFKENKDVKTVTQIVGGLNTGASVGNKGVAKGVKYLSQNDGVTSTVLGEKGLTDGGQKFKMGGTSNQAAGILKGVDGLNKVAGGASNLVNAIGMRGDADPANRERAKDDIVGGVEKIGGGLASTTTGVLQAIQGFATDPALAQMMQLDALPVVGIVASGMKLVDAAYTLVQASYRAGKIVAMHRAAKQSKDLAMAASLKHLRHADLKLVTSATVDIITNSASIAAHGLTLGGVTAPAGVALKAAASGISMAKSAAMTVHSSVKAAKGKKAQIKFDQAKKQGAGSGEIIKSGKQLIDNNSKYALQIVINAARDGDQTALDYMRLFNLDTKNFDEMSNENIRKYILGAIQADEEPETLLDKLKGVPGQLRGANRAIRGKFGKGY